LAYGEAAGDAPPSDVANKAQLISTLKQAHVDRPKNDEGFLTALQSVAPLLPEVPVATEHGKATSATFLFNDQEQHVGGVRFRVPSGPRRDMVWCFFMPPRNDYCWYIAPITGRMADGFRDYNPLLDFAPDAAAGITGLRRRSAVFQFLSGSVLTPGAEYILWFDFDKPGAVEVEMSVACLRAGTAKNTSDELAAAIGQQRIFSVPGTLRPSQCIQNSGAAIWQKPWLWRPPSPLLVV